MSNDMLKILIESACENGSINQTDRNLIEHKAQQMGISKDQVDKMIEEALAKRLDGNDDELKSGFISLEDEEKEQTPPPPPPPPPPPVDETKQKSKFTDVKPLSTQGAMSIVSQAKLHGKWIIIKRIKPKYKDNPKYKELFMREFENAYHLDHPHIVRLLDKGEDEEGLFYTMEYVDGRPLSQLFTHTGINNDSIAESVARQILDALGYVHKKQIFHRDLKPDNIYVTFRGDNVKILDFGLAAADNFDDDLLKVGTPRYAAPEQMQKGFDVDQRADIFSFGKIFLEMLTGKVEPSAAAEIKNNAYKYIITKAFAEKPADRFHNCDEIIRLLNNPQSAPVVETKNTLKDTTKNNNKPIKNTEPKPPKDPKKTPWLLIILAIVVIGGGIGSYFIFFHNKDGNTNIFNGNNNKTEQLISKGDSLYNVGEYVDAKSVYESIDDKNDHVTSQIVTLNDAIDDYNAAKSVFDQKNIARAKKLFKEILDKYPDFVDAKEMLDECNKIISNANVDNLQVESESGTNKLGLLDESGNVIIDFQFEEIYFEYNGIDWRQKGLIIVRNNNKYGFIDEKLNFFAKCEYSGYTFNGNNMGLVALGDGCKVSKDGKTVIISVDANGNGKIE
ncbi:MAG: protein kinase [Bacteroidales bacterium]|nr:protein kinase [Bacteroidales bacterium]